MELGRIPDRHLRTYPVNSTTQPPACGASTQNPPPGAGAGATRFRNSHGKSRQAGRRRHLCPGEAFGEAAGREHPDPAFTERDRSRPGGPGSGHDDKPMLDLALVYQPRRLVPDEAQQTLGRGCGLEHEPLESGFPVPRAVLDGAARAGRSPHGPHAATNSSTPSPRCRRSSRPLLQR